MRAKPFALIVIVSLGLFGFSEDTFAQTTTYTSGGTIGSDITIPSENTWIISPGATFTVNSGVTLTIDIGAVLENRGTIDNYGTIDNTRSASIINLGTINNAATGTIKNTGGFTFNNPFSGTRTVDGGKLVNYKTINNSGDLINNSFGIIKNSGGGTYGIGSLSWTFPPANIINNPNGAIYNYGVFDNFGVISNDCNVTITGSISGTFVDICDSDGDTVFDHLDNCPAIANTSQADADSDGIGDVCDPFPNDPDNDFDGDGVNGHVDNCPATPNPGDRPSTSPTETCRFPGAWPRWSS